MEEDDKVMEKEQNELSENLNHWDYIDRYSRWMYHTYQEYINDGDRIFDVGAGMGRMVKFYINRAAQITATDIFQMQVDYMNERFRRYANFNAVLWDIMKDEVGDYKGKYDTVICINVLEHLKDDNLAIQKMKELLKPGGKLIIMVPALQKLYCSLDENVGHYRRYDKGDLQRLAKDNHLTIKKNIYFNQLGILPYWWKGKRKAKTKESFSSSLNENNSKIYNFASMLLEPVEKIILPRKGLSELIILRKE